MGFRDDDQAARARADALQRELAERERELAEREAELEQARAALKELGTKTEAGEAARRREVERAARRERKLARAKRKREEKQARPARSSPQKTSWWLGVLAMAMTLGFAFGQVAIWDGVVVPARCTSICQRDGLRFAGTAKRGGGGSGRNVLTACLCQSRGDTFVTPQRPLRRGKGDIVFNSGIWILRMLLSLALGMATFLGLVHLWERRKVKAETGGHEVPKR